MSRLYLTFDTPLGTVIDARFKFVVDGLQNTPNTTFGIYKIPSISWTEATFASSGSADVLWNATTEAIHLNGELPRFTFNTTDDLPPTGQTFEITVDKGLIDQGTTQWILAWTGESTWDSSIQGQMHYLQLQQPTLEVDAVSISDMVTTYLGIADDILDIESAKKWLIGDYNSSGGINEKFSTGAFPGESIYTYLWNAFGKNNHIKYNGSNTPPAATGEYLYTGFGKFEFRNYGPNPATPQYVVFFIDGDMDISGWGANSYGVMPANLRIVYVVNGDITFLDRVGGFPGEYSILMDGLFISRGRFITGDSNTLPTTNCPECKLVVKGGVIAQGGFDLGRDLGLSNDSAPAEQITFDPSYLYYFARIEDPDVPGLDYSLLGETGTVTRELPP